MEDKIRVLHDFDSPFLSGRYALKRGLQLIVYALSKKLPFIRPLVKDVYMESYEYCLTLARLDRLVGLQSVFGLTGVVEQQFPDLREKLHEMGYEAHKHVHFSKTSVAWDPPLSVDPKYWFFDQQYAAGEVKVNGNTEWAVFHADYPHLFDYYVSFLHESISEGLLKTRQSRP